MNEFGSMHKVRTQYCGLFELRICDGARMVAVVGPRRSRSGSTQVGDKTVEQNRQWAIDKARKFEMIGYAVTVASAS